MRVSDDHEVLVDAYFERCPAMAPVYRVLERKLDDMLAGDVTIRVQKTQITFSNRYNFGCASIPVRRRRGWPTACLMVTFGLADELHHPRVAVAVEVRPHRWTHHVLVERADEVDDELMGWLGEAAAFAATR